MAQKEYNLHFQKILSQLNAAQMKAVTETEGPVIAIAGPGTGKTHILTARIGQILLTTDAQAHNILCLTFTDAAVNAMRQRLLDFIGPEAHRVHIYTFHSFCNKVIQENLEVFGRHDLEPLSDLERIEIIRNIINELDVEHSLKMNQRDPYHYEQHLADLFKRMKAERWPSDFIQQHIQNYLAFLPKRPEMRYKRNAGNFKKGDLKEAQFQNILKKMTRLGEAVLLFEQYEAALLERQRYDYEDMILWVLEAFEQDEFLLRSYQEQYLYLLVDEFQDTNGSQSAIVQQLVAYWGDNPNLFIVGDDDQSIYEFQGARVKNMTDFYEQYYKNLLLIMLKENYRSSQNILDAARDSIEHNEIRIINQIEGLELNKVLLGANPSYATIDAPVQIIAYPNQLQEEIAIVQQIEQLQQKGVNLKDIAIIYAKHRQADTLIQLFEKRDIPYQSKRRINILELPIVHNLRKLMGYIANEYSKPYSNEDIFFEFLHYDFVGITAKDAAILTAWMAKRTKNLLQNRSYENLPMWRDTIRDQQLLESLGLESIPQLIRFSDFIDNSIHQYKSFSLPQLFEYIINKSGLIQFIATHKQKAWLTQVVGTLFEFVKQETAKNQQISLNHLLILLDQMEANRIGMGLFQLRQAEDGVNLITAHSAKGLEFEYVFMINGLKDYWEPRSSAGKHFAFPDTLTYSNETDAQEAARRLFYVAMTRAKKSLQISYFQYNTNHKLQTKACFIDELLQAHNPSIVFSEQEVFLSEDWQLLLLEQAPPKPQIPLLSTAMLDSLLEGFKLSISAMNSYIYCPLSFYYEYILRVPSLSSVEAAYGTAIHNSLNRIFNIAIRKNENQLPEIDQLLDIFRFEMKNQRIFLSNRIYKERLELGQRHLPLYYKARKEDWNKLLQEATILTEKPLRNVEWKGVPLTGTIDKLLFLPHTHGKKIHVVDYKTGKLQDRRLNSPTKSNPYGGIYWRQLIFYKILLENSNLTSYKVRSAEIDYLTPNEEGVFPNKSITFDTKEVNLVKKMIQQVYDNIINHRFAEGCGEAHCKWCNFAQRNLIPASFSHEEIELLDD
ncbi:ATP-dependent helicase [Aureispira anguillae]|uniref:DNA 3'-5' helicase n=1 Tax=Aureispira anguillae TaxID=2864201 RepID=A0A916DWW5_9BACT|nr:ATP-dependent DNA helicase [Aureispira anguillae]BDS14441.1 ATP-dependent helicase [Aureispira anguillae]